MTFHVSNEMAKTLKKEAKDRGLLFSAYLEQLVYIGRMQEQMKAAEVKR